jgi:hypothetical protein
MVVLSIVFFLIYRKIQYRIFDQIDIGVQEQDEYTIFIENIPVLDINPKDN